MASHESEPTASSGRPEKGSADGDGADRGRTLPFPEQALPRPERIGPYKILDVLGEGGMGIVYLAEQAEPVRRRVALKVIKLGMDTREVVARFEAERQALALLDHPGIARMHDAGATEDGRPYFVMEYVHGVPMLEYCDRHKLDLRERLGLFAQVCRAVDHAHHRGIVHRDLKPSNILVSTPDEGPVAKIIDFGVSKATNQRLTEKTVYTELGRFIGTPAYMSPEQAERTSEDVDHRSDVYSLGVLLYELLVGELPLSLDSHKIGFDEIVRRIRDEDPPTPSARWTQLNLERTRDLASKRRTSPAALRSELRGDLDWVTMKAMEKERERRYPSAAHLAEEIDRFLRGEPVLAGPPGVAYRAKKYVRRHRTMVVAMSAVILALTVGLAVSIAFAVLAARSEKKAVESEALARAQLEEILRLSDMKDLETCRLEADGLWPASSAKVAALEAWLVKARALAERLPEHRRTLENLRAGKAVPYTQEDARRQRWWHDALAALVRDLEKFTDPNSTDPLAATIVGVEKRLEFARTVRKRTIEDPEVKAKWQEAIVSIRTREECPKYGGLEIVRQEGLVPIGPDPRSGLWEFAHLQTGDAPARGPDGKLVVTEETGLVFVLIPGGTFRMGSVKPDEKNPVGSPNVDPDAESDEGPVHEVRLAPFFISKYEMTQGEWRRFAGKNPSAYRPGASFGGKDLDLRHPVEQVSWEECSDLLGRLALVLPTEALWEYAARGGTGTVWWTGSDERSLQGAANLADSFSKKHGGHSSWQFEEWFDDGYTVHAPVGSFAPNAFGLHDVHGNVWEWCRDGSGSYDLPWREGDGERQVSGARFRVGRGGSFVFNAAHVRVAVRFFDVPGFRGYHLGVRPARVITP